ncbi:MBL fold metallo-hydrolase [Altererythrobacter sp. Z27]|uniref:MBL fold metallo-hydrolase n=1 Tax=Altererythrobacter sp. Z27 TaxID=3461147 RepID=UPI004043A427
MTKRHLARSVPLLLCALGLSVPLGVPLHAQDRDLPEHVRMQLNEADAIAGDDRLLHVLRNYHCYYVDPAPAPFRPTVMDETDFLFGTPILDNVTYLGYFNLAVYAIETSAGLVLIDAGGTVQQGERILGWLAEAGFAPADVKWIILTHEHVDHVAGAEVLREATGARIIASSAALDSASGGIPESLQPVDLVIADRTAITLGDSEFVLLPTPGHSPGTLSVFATVLVDGKRHMASFWGGKGMRPHIANLRQMLDSVGLFSRESEALGVDVPLNTHSWGDGTVARLVEEILAPELPNPFVLSPEQNAANLELLRLCTSAYLDAVTLEQARP